VPIDPSSPADRAAAHARSRQRRRARAARLVIVFCGFMLLLNALLGDQSLLATIKSRENVRRTAQELASLKEQNVALRAEAHRLREDPAALERVARQELGLARPGEILIVLSDTK
jgi:cell division protein FtsB